MKQKYKKISTELDIVKNRQEIEQTIFERYIVYIKLEHLEPELAGNKLKRVLEIFLKWMTRDLQKNENWYMDILLFFLDEFITVCHKLDKKHRSHKWKHRVDCIIKNIFRCISQNRVSSEYHPNKYVYGLSVELFKIYIKMGNYRLCSGLRKQLDSAVFPELEKCPRKHALSFLFYCGIFDLLHGDYQSVV